MRSSLLRVLLGTMVGGVAVGVVPVNGGGAIGVAAEPRRGTVTVSERAREVHARGFVFDGHNDLPWTMRTEAGSSFDKADIAKPQPKFHTDIPRLRAGNVGAQFWSVYVPVETAKSGQALLQTLEQIELVKAMIARYPDVFAAARTADDVVRIRQSGKIASLIGVEGGHCIENSLENLRRLHQLGAGYLTLTHSDTLDWADSASDKAKSGGLNEFGEAVVLEMNRLGMLVDLSHVAPETMRDALRVSRAPIIFSHSSARGVADHVRNVPDDVLREVKRNRGVVMVNFSSGFVHPESARRRARMFEVSRELREKFPNEEDYKAARRKWEAENPIERGDVHDLVDHIDHIAKVGGVDAIGIGSDYDGIPMTPKQLDDVSTYPVITQVLLDRGYSESDIHKILSGNVLRVMREAESAAQRLKDEKPR